MSNESMRERFLNAKAKVDEINNRSQVLAGEIKQKKKSNLEIYDMLETKFDIKNPKSSKSRKAHISKMQTELEKKLKKLEKDLDRDIDALDEDEADVEEDYEYEEGDD